MYPSAPNTNPMNKAIPILVSWEKSKVDGAMSLTTQILRPNGGQSYGL